MQTEISGLEAGAAAIGVNLDIIDAKVLLMSSDRSDLKGDVSSLKRKTNDLESAVPSNANNINNINGNINNGKIFKRIPDKIRNINISRLPRIFLFNLVTIIFLI
jgi:hypothetical protein